MKKGLMVIISDGSANYEVVVPDAILERVVKVNGFEAVKLIAGATGFKVSNESVIVSSRYAEIRPPNLIFHPVTIAKNECLKDTRRPPLNAAYLLYVFLSKNDPEAVAGDLEERWRKIKKKFGVRRANFWYWTQVVRSLWPFGLAALKRVSGLLALIEMWRRTKR